MAETKDAAAAAPPSEPVDTQDVAPESALKAPRFGRKQKIIAGALAAAIITAGATSAYFLSDSGDRPHETVAMDDRPPAVELPDLIVNLRSPDGQARFLKIRLMLEPTDATKSEAIAATVPNIIDAYQPFLCELRPEDVSGSAAVFRLKEELLLRTAGVVGNDTVRGVLVQDLIQQ